MFYTVPSYWDLEIFKSCQDSPTMRRAIGNLKSSVILFLRARQTVKNASSKEFPASFMTWLNFRWSLAAVMTRQNHIPMPQSTDKTGIHRGQEAQEGQEGQEGQREEEWKVVPALVPGWDFMNHEEGPSTSHFDVGTYVHTVHTPAISLF